MMDDRKKKILVGTVIIILVVGVISIIVSGKSSPRCELTNTKPVPGYLIYHDQSKAASYLPLGLESLTYIDQDDALKMTTNCAKLDLYHLFYDLGGVGVRKIRIELTVPTKESNASEFECIIVAPNMYAPSGRHYGNSDEDSYQCTTNSGANLTLVVQKLEFEVNGDSKDIKEGKYSTPATNKLV